MRGLCENIEVISATVPTEDIARNRRDFPGAKLSFHLELVCRGLADLTGLCQLLAAAGLTLKSLRASETGMVYCVLLDNDAADLTRLATDLGASPRLMRWTTQVEF